MRTYTEALSRDLFTACDSDGDDRLDLFEAAEALDALRDLRDRDAFVRLDGDRDGFLSWPEFDQHFWSVIQFGGTFHLRPCRALVEQAPEQRQARPASPLQRFVALHDSNGNGALDPDEVERMVVRTELPPNVSAQLRGLDRDKSGRIDEAELAPWFELLRGRVPEATPQATPARGGGPLLPPWHDNDADGNGRIDRDELAAALRRIDPSLARWAEALLRALDLDRDGQLDAAELPATRRAARSASTAASAPSTEPSPVAGTASR